MPESMDMYTLYHYNSTDTTVRDMDENCYARTSVVFEPLSIISTIWTEMKWQR